MSADPASGHGPVEERVQAVIRRVLGRETNATPIGVNLELRDVGVDSIKVVDLLLELETEFGLTFPDTVLTAETFRTVSNVTTVLYALQQAPELHGVRDA